MFVLLISSQIVVTSLSPLEISLTNLDGKETKLFITSIHFFTENKRVITRGLIGTIFVLVAVWFIRHEKEVVREVYLLIQSVSISCI